VQQKPPSARRHPRDNANCENIRKVQSAIQVALIPD
jgi:hypothetical protein